MASQSNEHADNFLYQSRRKERDDEEVTCAHPSRTQLFIEQELDVEFLRSLPEDERRQYIDEMKKKRA